MHRIEDAISMRYAIMVDRLRATMMHRIEDAISMAMLCIAIYQR